jgi:glutathione S-transferase
MIELVIATQKNYSSWSLRGWLVMRWAGIAFSERAIDLAQPGYGQQAIGELLAVSPGGLVPALRLDGATIWDSLAIAEWAAEQNPSLWPADPLARALARAITAEMHSGAGPIRRDLSMNLARRCQAYGLPDETLHSIDRIQTIWRDCRARFGAHGPWLFGQRSIADAFYLPVATRFRTYGIALDPVSQAWADTALADPDFLEWEAGCEPNSWDHHGFSVIDGLYPEQEVPA